jgi:ATP-dependent 26S proteasome regulatory subunit
MVSFESTMWGGPEVVFHERPSLQRGEVILPENVLREIERHTLLVGECASALVAAGRHLKRGLLLYGPPGTGKTHTVRWITAELADTTVLVLSGGSLGAVGPVCRLARELAPSLLVLEDVDLVAGERTMRGHGGPLLFQLLNELDGMADDADVAVVLTSNRPELLEPALAARPGRVDLAVETPLPDADCRRRLFDLYSRGMTLELADREAIITRTKGVTASFFRELLRQAVLEAVTDDSGVVRDEHIAAGLGRLLNTTNEMTRVLLGATPHTGTAGFRGPETS